MAESSGQDPLVMLREAAAAEAGAAGHHYLGVEHLFITLTRVREGLLRRSLQEMGLDDSEIRHAVRARYAPDPGEGDGLPLPTERCGRVLARCQALATADGAPRAGERHLVLAVLEEPRSLVAVALAEVGVDWDRLVQTARRAARPAPAADAVLAQVGRDLTALAAAGELHEAIGRREELLEMARTLARRTKSNPLLIGEAGVGKSAVVEGLAWRIAQRDLPGFPELQDKRIIEISPSALVAGTSLRGQFEERINSLLREVREAAGEVILFIDEIHLLVGAGGSSGGMDAAQLFKPALARGDFACIGATTQDEYRRYIEPDGALERRFQCIVVEEPDQATTLAILQAAVPRYQEHHQVMIPDETLARIVDLAAKLLPDRRFPDKAFDLLDQACARRRIGSLSVGGGPERGVPSTVEPEAVAEVISAWTGVPVTALNEDERRRLSGLRDWLAERVIGQPEAVATVAQAVRRARAGLTDPQRPTGVFLFAGSTGVGKTELAKALAEFLFHTPSSLIRIDMSEYMEKHNLSRLIGSPPGYVGHEEEGQLTGALRRRPYAVVLLDEFEKAHPDVWNLFLQLFDDGRLTDSHGRTADGRQAVFIMTTNAGVDADTVRDCGGDAERLAAHVQEALRHTFTPEFLNRIDSVTVFRPLGRADLRRVAEVMVAPLVARLAEHGCTLSLAAEALDRICDEGFDPAMGARPLRRAIQRLLEDPLSDLLLDRDPGAGGSIEVTCHEGELRLTWS